MNLKALFLLLIPLTFVSCGDDKKSKPHPLREDQEKAEVLPTCEAEESIKCSQPTQYVIVSNQKLPKKLKVYFKTDEKRSLVFNQCNSKSIYQLYPSEGVTTMGFREKSELFQSGMSLEIVDAGEDCDNDAVFFDEAITPVDSDSWVNTRVTKTFNLSN